MLLQNFNFVLEPNYVLGFKQTLTIKPKDMHMRAILRDDLTPTSLQHRLSGNYVPKANGTNGTNKVVNGTSAVKGVPLTILYGSNSGTCEALAQRIATDAASHGFTATKIDCLDSANDNLPTDQPVLIVTASYEGQPPDNAGHFVAWIEGMKKEESPLKGVSYAVFGCGNRDWTQTFHRIPKLVDSRLAELGAERVANLGLSDVSTGQVFADFESWEDGTFWPALMERFNATASEEEESKVGVNVSISTPRASTLRQDVKEGVVVKAETLSKESDKSAKKHIEVRLPKGLEYSVGDYLVVLPINPKESVQRVMRRFRLPWDAHLQINTDGPSTLPTNSTIAANDIFSSYVELSQPATKRVSSRIIIDSIGLC